uniref:Ig-like domain-containing protein n=1 Tax=Labrus bergylta TaxID=56723 RepID=A0A3Q3H2A2_9LABR
IPQIPMVEKRLVLCCRVENFYPSDVDLVWSRDDGEQVCSITHYGPFSNFCPEDLTVTWTKNEEEVPSGVFNTPPSLNINGLYSMFTFLNFTPAEDDRGAEFRCKVVHSAQKEPGEERFFTLPVLQVPNGC